ncbi:ATPase [Mycolicibacterium gadium]|uniref:ATPase n=2 Tax=Mycolicibacterium gadium TaxID=1794 RepID=A0A7I7WT82_MYCGU|nr:ATPase [Mycolicibacterium gadium]
MSDRLVTPTKITAWLDCPHYLTLRNQVEDGQLQAPPPTFGSFARLVQRKGEIHELDCLAEYELQGKHVYPVPGRRTNEHESFEAWVKRVGNPLADGHDVLYQMPFIHDSIRGIADFVERVEDPESGDVSYEPVDAKLSRSAAKPGHVLQLCFYADAIKALTGADPRHMHIWLGSGRRETLRVNEFRPYWRRLRAQLAVAISADVAADTHPEPCSHCEFCEFAALCDAQWREEDSLTFIPGIRPTERTLLSGSGVTTVAELGVLNLQLSGIRPERLHWLVQQAALQVEARLNDQATPPFTMIDLGENPLRDHGFANLPKPDDGDVFLDFEGHPFWRAHAGLFFLFGLIEQRQPGGWAYRAWWAHNPDEEARAVVSLIQYLTMRRSDYPGMHVYHYNHTERSALQGLTAIHGVAEQEFGRLVRAGLFVDLLAVARKSFQVGVESYSLKFLERLTGYQRSHLIDKGAGAVVQYEKFMATNDPDDLTSIAAYNEDDVRATRAFRDWLITQRPVTLPWPEPNESDNDLLEKIDEQIAEFHAFEKETPDHLLGDLLGYWTREWWAYLMPKLADLQRDLSSQFDDREIIAALKPLGLRPRTGKNGQELESPAMRFLFPPQRVDGFPHGDESLLYSLPDGTWKTTRIDRLDLEAREVDLVWADQQAESEHVPTAVVLHTWIRTEPKRLALSDFASRLLEGDRANPATEALLRRELPRFAESGGPPNALFTDDLAEMKNWARNLDNSYVAVQGPPGTGKTYRAAHMVHALVSAGKRIGITAFSHRAIENLLREIVKVFGEYGDLERLCGVRNQTGDKIVGFRKGNAGVAAQLKFNVVAGTPWLFSSEKLRASPVDVLMIDEAGQLALADALAASTSSRSMILLGDPSQLPQVMQAVHPGGGGRSALEHVLGDEVTMPADRGPFLAETRRMHPDISNFISEEIYGGRLTYHENCRKQTTVAGTGLRWVAAEHLGNSTSSVEEAVLIADAVTRLVGTPWTNFNGEINPLTVRDFMVVAPYNDQVRTIKRLLDSNARSAGVPVGTVDKFQGGQAAVVFFSMATSSGADMIRSADFLFSRNRLNVAISRARCLAYLVCTEGLLNARARTVEEMRLISTLNAFVERAQR